MGVLVSSVSLRADVLICGVRVDGASHIAEAGCERRISKGWRIAAAGPQRESL